MFSADLGGVAASSTPSSNDPPFQKVALLLHGDGTNGAQNNTFVDSSTNNFTITRTGNVAQGTFSPFSQAAGYWSAWTPDGAYYNIASMAAIGTSDFTVEAWVYLDGSKALNQFCIDLGGGYSSGASLRIDQSSLGYLRGSIAVYIAGTGTFWAYTFPYNVLTHIAYVRSSGTVTIYVNGNSIGAGQTNSGSIGSGGARIAGILAGGAQTFQGYISNVRVVNGTAVYTSNFTPSTTPLTAITNTVLLTLQSNRFKDNSSNNYTITLTGSPAITAFSPFAPSAAYSASTNGGSGYFDGSGDYLSAADNANLRFGTSSFTIQAWVYRNATGTAHSIVSKGGASTGFTLGITSTNILRFTDTTTNIDTTTTIPAGTWTHVAAVRTNTSTNGFQLYINGISSKTATVSTDFNQTDTLYVGADRGAANVMNGYITDLRYVNGTAETITVPTAPLTAVTNTQLLLNCTNAGIYDNAAKNDIETVGNAQISTSVKKYGTGSISFDGNGDYLKYFPLGDLQGFRTGDFTIECWINFNSVSSSVIVGNIDSNGGGDWAFIYNSSVSQLRLILNNLAVTLSSSSWTPTAGTWYHIAVTRSSSTYRFFVNGVVTGSGSNTTNITWTATNPSYVGTTNNSGLQLNGYIDDLRITKGQALYTSNFTPPTQAFPNV